MPLAVLLVLEGFASTFHDKVFKARDTSKYDPMLYINLGSYMLSSLMVIAFGDILHALAFSLNSAPLWKYLSASTSNVYAGACQYEALKCGSFPVQMPGKSFMVMLVIVWGTIVPGKHYGATDWLIAGAVTGCATELCATGPFPSSDDFSSIFGLMLSAGFLVPDGCTSTSKYNQMLYINLGSLWVCSRSMYY